jgi:ribosomal protein S18 acetylase RimI-like enzyme
MKVITRWYIPQDIPAMQTMESFIFGEHAIPRKRFHAMTTNPSAIGIIAVTKTDRLLGYVIGQLLPTRHKALISRFGVHPCYRRKEVGSQMMEHFLDRLDHIPGLITQTLVKDDNLPCHLFLQSQGFVASIAGLRLNDHGEVDGHHYCFVRQGPDVTPAKPLSTSANI